MSDTQDGFRAPSIMFYNLDGIPSEEPRGNLFWIREGWDSFALKENDLTYDIEGSAFALRNWIAATIFGSLSTYYEALAFSNMLIVQGGVDSDIKVSKEMFEKYVRNLGIDERKLIYYHDVINLVGALQNSVQEVKHLMGEFYKEFNVNSFMLGPPFESDIVMHASGLLVTKLFTFVNYIFVSLYSQMDFLAKIAYECQHMERTTRDCF